MESEQREALALGFFLSKRLVEEPALHNPHHQASAPPRILCMVVNFLFGCLTWHMRPENSLSDNFQSQPTIETFLLYLLESPN